MSRKGFAKKIPPQRAWLWVERSWVFKCEDRPDDALAAARRACELQPWYRPAVQHAANWLVQLNRETEALELLREGIERIESGDLLTQLAMLEYELGQYAEARRHFERVPDFQPLRRYDKGRAEWLATHLSDAAYYAGDLAAAAEYARQAKTPFYEQLAERLQNGESGRRCQMPVTFVLEQQHSCAPATLAALSGFWSKPAKHLEVAEKICYDGTPGHSERRWCEEHGFACREFRVTWESALALLDQGVPFTLTTVLPGKPHLQAVIGYDTFRRRFVVRDPSERHTGEFLADKLLEQQSSSGPRGTRRDPV